MLLWAQTLPSTPEELVGTQPSFTNIRNLLRLDGTTSNDGAWGGVLNTRGTITYTTDVPFGSGQSAIFNGSSGLFNGSGPIIGTGGYTAACWVKFLSAGEMSLIQQRDAQNTGQFMVYVTAAGIGHYEGNSSNVFANWYATPLQLNTWMHIAAVRNGTSHKLFLNGVVVASTTKSPYSIGGDNGLSIGYDQRDNNKFVNGYMKDVLVAARALSDDEILWLAQNERYFPPA